MRIKVATVALAASMVTIAAASAVASAAELRIEGLKQSAGFSEKTAGSAKSAVLKVSSGPTVTCATTSSSGELELTETAPGVFVVSKLNVVVVYGSCNVTNDKETEEACEVSPIEVLAANKELTVSGETGKVLFEQRPGKPLAEITIKSKTGKTCPLTVSKQKLTGTQECTVVSITTELVEHELSCPSSGSKLSLGEKTATVERGTEKFSYTGTNKGKKFSVH